VREAHALRTMAHDPPTNPCLTRCYHALAGLQPHPLEELTTGVSSSAEGKPLVQLVVDTAELTATTKHAAESVFCEEFPSLPRSKPEQPILVCCDLVLRSHMRTNVPCTEQCTVWCPWYSDLRDSSMCLGTLYR
jgi:hypothetical protein